MNVDHNTLNISDSQHCQFLRLTKNNKTGSKMALEAFFCKCQTKLTQAQMSFDLSESLFKDMKQLKNSTLPQPLWSQKVYFDNGKETYPFFFHHVTLLFFDYFLYFYVKRSVCMYVCVCVCVCVQSTVNLETFGIRNLLSSYICCRT